MSYGGSPCPSSQHRRWMGFSLLSSSSPIDNDELELSLIQPLQSVQLGLMPNMRKLGWCAPHSLTRKPATSFLSHRAKARCFANNSPMARRRSPHPNNAGLKFWLRRSRAMRASRKERRVQGCTMDPCMLPESAGNCIRRPKRYVKKDQIVRFDHYMSGDTMGDQEVQMIEINLNAAEDATEKFFSIASLPWRPV